MTKSTKYLLICIIALFSLACILKCFYFTFKTGGSDLRMRIVGARLLSTENSPYFYKWSAGDGERLLDPNDQYDRLLNGNVVTPATLLVIYPLAKLPYPTIRIWWAIFQLAAVGLIVFLGLNNNNNKLLAAGVVVIGLICTDNWFLHVERGQMYIFYALHLTLIYFLFENKFKHHIFLSGILGGLLIFFRPYMGIIALPFLLAGRKKWLFGWLTGILLGFLIFVLPCVHLWEDYFKAMQGYVNECMETARNLPATKPPIIPSIIEGSDNLRMGESFNISHLFGLYYYLNLLGINYSNTRSIIIYVSLIFALSTLFIRNKSIRRDTDKMFLFAFLLYILAELVLINPRGAYNIILWIFPLFLLVRQFASNYFLFTLLICSFLLLHHFPFIFPFQSLLSELGLLSLLTYAIFNFYKPETQSQLTSRSS